ncbi:hypothetical protein OG978_30505 [Streptomyces sp. NBC_01591]|uniref:hypothetical protein n=1 Tax=Streptomyces sp. NBC_01591 TaxID=2975888 RepID=UPI002DDB46D3|nr:hypothetical protein [Streptomyces sp. NBC_01591]WSD71332.1 hypothetical protein OG978_30505 [Streptomyces sp. NBC_01591]
MSQVNRAPGAQPTRRSGRWERYRDAHPFSAQDQAGLWGLIVGVVALAVLLGWALDMKGGAVIVAAIPFIISWYEKRRTAFQFDAAGARFGNVLLPWTDFTQFVVATPPDDQQALIGARLRPGATLSAGAMVPSQKSGHARTDPRRRSAVQVRSGEDGRQGAQVRPAAHPDRGRRTVRRTHRSPALILSVDMACAT